MSKSNDFDIYRVKKCQKHESGVIKIFDPTLGYLRPRRDAKMDYVENHQNSVKIE